jgi:hypothetical protein
MTRRNSTGIPAASLLGWSFHNIQPAPAPVEKTEPKCGDCGTTGPRVCLAERWNEETRSWDHFMGCCGAERDELGCRPKARAQ